VGEKIMNKLLSYGIITICLCVSVAARPSLLVVSDLSETTVFVGNTTNVTTYINTTTYIVNNLSQNATLPCANNTIPTIINNELYCNPAIRYSPVKTNFTLGNLSIYQQSGIIFFRPYRADFYFYDQNGDIVFTITNESISAAKPLILGTPLSVDNGGTGGTAGDDARDNLNLAIPSDCGPGYYLERIGTQDYTCKALTNYDTITLFSSPMKWQVDTVNEYEYPNDMWTDNGPPMYRTKRDFTNSKAVRLIVNNDAYSCNDDRQIKICAVPKVGKWNTADDKLCVITGSGDLLVSDWVYLDGNAMDEEVWITGTDVGGTSRAQCEVGLTQLQVQD
jgi:hypothetical protein